MDFFIDIFWHIDQYLITFIQEYHEWTYPLLFSIVFCETGLVVLPFLPGDSLLFASGAVASLSEIPLELDWLMLTFSTAAMFGDSCNYLIGLYFGKKLFTKLNSKIFKQHYIEKTHYFFINMVKNNHYCQVYSSDTYFHTVCCWNGKYELLHIFNL